MTTSLPLAALVLPAALAYVLISRTGLWRSGLLRGAMAWFVGQSFATLLVFGLAMALEPFTTGVLRKAVGAVLSGTAVALAALLWRFRSSLSDRVRAISWKRAAAVALFFAVCSFFSWSFFSVHLAQWPAGIWKSGVYKDFNIHYPTIQNFVYGDNFPPQYESFAGAPLAYHFFFDLLVAEHVALGWPLVAALNGISAAAFVTLLALIAGFVEEFAGSFSGGIVAVALTLTSSSLFCLDAIAGSGARSARELWRRIWENDANAYQYALMRADGVHYNGAMFNLYYFLAERQLVFGAGLLLAALSVLAVRRRLSGRACALTGAATGLVFFWNVYTALAIGGALAALLAIAPERRKTAALLAGWAVVALGAGLATRAMLARPEWFLPGARAGPRFDLGFTILTGEPPPSLLHALRYWGYGYGLKLALLPLGLLEARRRSRELFLVLVAAIAPAFALVNCVALAPLSVYDNHKWLRPMNILVDAAVALLVWSLLARGRTAGRALGAIVLLPLTLSGAIELVPFLRARPVYRYAAYPTDLTRVIREKTPPRAVFLASDPPAIHLAGRKVFLGRRGGPFDAANELSIAPYNTPLRKGVAREIVEAESLPRLCALAGAHGIDFVEVPPGPEAGPGILEAYGRSGFAADAGDREPARFADVKGACGFP
jgi:hypothetical protein